MCMTKQIEISELAAQFGLGPHPEADARANELDAAGMNVVLQVNSRTTILTASWPNKRDRIVENYFDD